MAFSNTDLKERLIQSPITPKIKGMIGMKYGMLTVVSFAGKVKSEKGNTSYYVNVKCDCGTECISGVNDITLGGSTSCGCFRKAFLSESHSVHGHKCSGKTSREYSSWQAMRNRCYRKLDAHFKDYGGRGIVVCDRWKNSFYNFYADMGPRPKDCTIDRIDNSGNYELCNCRWASVKAQNNNRRSTVVVEIEGEKMSLKAAAKKLGIQYTTLISRKNNRRISGEEAVLSFKI